MNRRGAIGVTIAIAAVALAAAGSAAWRVWGARAPGPGDAIAADRPLAAVLLPGAGATSCVAIVDLDALRVVRRMPLRSTASEMAADASGRLVTAQCGGVGSESDDVAGVLDPRSGKVSYVRLERPNPSSVVSLDGTAYLLHGWTDTGHEGTFFVSAVDPRGSRVTSSGYVPESLGLWGAGGARLWLVGRDEAAESCPLVSVRPSDMSTSVVLPDGRPVNAVVDGTTTLYLLATRLPCREATSGYVVEVDPGTLRTGRSAELSGLVHGAVRGAATGGVLAVIDDLGEGDSSEAVTLVDRSTLRVIRTVRVPGTPAAVAAWGERFVVIDREGGTLRLIDARDGRVSGPVDLGETDMPWTDVEILPALARGVSVP